MCTCLLTLFRFSLFFSSERADNGKASNALLQEYAQRAILLLHSLVELLHALAECKCEDSKNNAERYYDQRKSQVKNDEHDES